MFEWLFHILIFATSGKYQNKEKPLKRQRKLGLPFHVKYIHPKATLLIVYTAFRLVHGPR